MRLVFTWLLAIVLSTQVAGDAGKDNKMLYALGLEEHPYYLYLASVQHHSDALSQLSQYAVDNKHIYWLHQAAELGDVNAQYHLAHEQSESSQHRAWLTKAAHNGLPLAQYELAMQSQPQQQKLWLTAAAEQGYVPAQIALYQWWLLRDDLEQGQEWLFKAAQHDSASALALGRFLWAQEQYEDARSWLQRASEKEPEAENLVTLIDNYWPENANSATELQLAVQRPQCAIQLQFIATSLEAMARTKDIQQSFARDKRLSQLPVCVNEPQWHQEIRCSANWQGNARLGCDLTVLAAKAHTLAFTHLVIVAEQGKANVNNGVMFLDLADSYSVFVHELAHFAGFVDEYPLSVAMAEQFCHKNISAPNVRYLAEGDELSSLDTSDWRSHTDEVIKLGKARTCDNVAGQAYKASGKLTFMEYHDQAHIPALYIKMWQQRLQQKQHLVPAFINLAHESEANGKFEQAQHWWQQYRQFKAE